MSKRPPTPPAPDRTQWRSPAERDPAVLHEAAVREFPAGASELDGTSRREFIQFVGASMALAGVGSLAGCKDPPPNILPYNVKPSDVTPGRPQHYASSLTRAGYATGVLVTTWSGRPTKIEGNPDHPFSRGATSSFDQGEILSLYDPARTRQHSHNGHGKSWKQFCVELEQRLAGMKDGGAKVAFLLEPSTSPLIAALQKRVAAALPKARWYGHSAVSMDAAYDGAKIAFGRPLETLLDLSRGRVVVALDADFLGAWPQWLGTQRQWAERRSPGADMSRLYVAEAPLTCTGMMADHRLPVRAADIGRLARALHAALTGGNADAGSAKANAWVKAAAKDLTAAHGEAVVVVGPRQPAAVHALGHAINAALKSVAVTYSEPLLPTYEPIEALAVEMKAGRIDTLAISAWNPAYSIAGDTPFGALLAQVPNSIYLAPYHDETAKSARWILARAHDLESWGDARSADGTASFQQPLITPLFGGVSVAELLAAFAGQGGAGGYALLRDAYQQLDELAFQHQLQKGVVEKSAPAKITPTTDTSSVLSAAAKLDTADGLEVNIVPDYKVFDGRYANNVWMQELPDPVTKLTWDNALLLSPATARKLGLKRDDLAELKLDGKRIELSVLPSPGHAEASVTIALGYGRTGAEENAHGAGVNVYPLRSGGRWFAVGATLTATGLTRQLAVTQEHWAQEGRDPAIQVANKSAILKRLPLVAEHKGETESLYQEHVYPGFRWAMAIDLNRCTGCSACVVACQAENNIPVVGREQVKRSREMHWLRMDVYFEGDTDNPESAISQPMMCVQCEKAPCEYVCPVHATVHSDEGLNEMIYNRCIGTRYCSNNCPYKVRRFNFLDYHPNVQPLHRMAMNPDVSVRSRGVMEKCTYCVQRIEHHRIDARVAGRSISDGEFTTACAQVCPSRAIVFGSLHDKSAEVSRWHDDARSYDVLHELGTRPRTAYLARVKNKNPELNHG